jgi:hypothetical protein
VWHISMLQSRPSPAGVHNCGPSQAAMLLYHAALAKLPSVIDWVMHALGARKISSRGAQVTDSPGGAAC